MRALLLAAVCLVACSKADSGNPQPAILDRQPTCGVDPYAPVTDSGIGSLVVGATIGRIQRECNVVADRREETAEGDPVRLIYVAMDSTTVEALLVDDRVWRIEIASRGLITADSIGVGSLLGRIVQLQDVTGLEGEGALYVRMASHCGISFRTTYQPDAHRDKAEWTRATLARLPDSVTIDRILVFGCGEHR